MLYAANYCHLIYLVYFAFFCPIFYCSGNWMNPHNTEYTECATKNRFHFDQFSSQKKQGEECNKLINLEFQVGKKKYKRSAKCCAGIWLDYPADRPRKCTVMIAVSPHKCVYGFFCCIICFAYSHSFIVCKFFSDHVFALVWCPPYHHFGFVCVFFQFFSLIIRFKSFKELNTNVLMENSRKYRLSAPAHSLSSLPQPLLRTQCSFCVFFLSVLCVFYVFLFFGFRAFLPLMREIEKKGN